MTKKTVTRSSLAAHLFCDVATVDAYRIGGIIARLADGRYDEAACRQRVLAHLRDKSGGRAGHSGADLAHERALLAKEQRETASIRNALARGELVSVSSVRRIVGAEYATIREQILSVAGANANEIATRARDAATVEEATAVVESTLTDINHEVLLNLSDPEKIAAAAAKKIGNGHEHAVEMGKRR
jgi:hypothetical protein